MAHAPRESSGDVSAEFVRHIVSDPKNVPDVMLLNGYLGASSEEAHERLYLRPDLSNYVEIPRSAILYQATLPKEQDAHGGVTVWVRRDAALQYRMAPAAQALANYFAGAIAAGAAARPIGAGGTMPQCQPIPAGATAPNVCLITPNLCCYASQHEGSCAQTPGCPTHNNAQTPCAPCATMDNAPTVCVPCETQNNAATPCVPCATPQWHCTRVAACYPTPQQACGGTPGMACSHAACWPPGRVPQG
jgi:hypothetical protein